MRMNLKLIFVVIILGALLSPFTNCDNQADSTLFRQLNPENCLELGDEFCFQAKKDNLALSSSMTQLRFKSAQISFNVGGECNEGGFPMNRIDWEVRDEQSLSLILSSVSGGETICTNPSNIGIISDDRSGTCVKGRFNIPITLPAQYAGLRPGGTPRSYDLKLCITGIDRETNFKVGGSTLHIDLDPM